MFKQIIHKIEEASSIIIVGHIRPDGDCYGSQIGLKEVIKNNFPEKKVYAVGTGLPFFFNTLGGMDEIDEEIVKNSLTIIVDVSEHHRIDHDLVREFAQDIIVIDHHVLCEPCKYINVINENACSACELIVKLILEAGWELNPIAASALYLGILTDTARFNYLDEYAETHRLCAFLCDYGANPALINTVLSLSPESKLIVQGYVLTHYKKSSRGIIYIHLTQPEIQKLNSKNSVGSLVVNMIGNIVGYPIWAAFVDNEIGGCIMEFRSNRYPVCDVAVKHGGGGHRLAAGATIKNYTQEDIDIVLDELADLMEE